MRILIITDTMEIGGAEKLTALLADGFSDAGCDCSIMVLSDELAAVKYIHSEHVKVQHASHDYPLKYNSGKVRKVIREIVPDVILCQDLFSYMSMKLATLRRARIPTFLVLHYTMNCNLKDELFEYLYFLWIRHSRDRIICIYNRQREKFSMKHRLPLERFMMIHNGVDTGLFHPRSSPRRDNDKLRIVHVGNIKVEKDQLTLLKAVKILNEKTPDWEMEFCGRDDAGLKNKFVTYLKDNGIESKVTFHDYTANVSEVLKRADVFVLSSISEALPVSALEAIACGIPCILTDVGGCADIIDNGKNGFLVPPSCPEAIAAKLAFMAYHRGTLNSMGKKAREKAEKEFSLNIMVDSYLEAFRYTSIVNRD